MQICFLGESFNSTILCTVVLLGRGTSQANISVPCGQGRVHLFVPH